MKLYKPLDFCCVERLSVANHGVIALGLYTKGLQIVLR